MDECPWRGRPRHGTLAAVMQPPLRERLGRRGPGHLGAEDRADRAGLARSPPELRGRRRGSLPAASVGLAYPPGLPWGGTRGPAPVIHWTFISGALVGGGAFIGIRREHSDRLLDRLPGAARPDSPPGLVNRRGFEE